MPIVPRAPKGRGAIPPNLLAPIGKPLPPKGRRFQARQNPRKPLAFSMAKTYGTIGTIGMGRDKVGRAAAPEARPIGKPLLPIAAKRSDDVEERAAIVEFDGGIPRAWAEGSAALCAMPPPTGFTPARWQRITDATGAFLDRGGADAARLGWSDLDAFGCHPERPAARFDCMGLILLLDRCEAAAIDRDGADLLTVTGARQRFRRRPMPPGTVPLWRVARRLSG